MRRWRRLHLSRQAGQLSLAGVLFFLRNSHRYGIQTRCIYRLHTSSRRRSHLQSFTHAEKPIRSSLIRNTHTRTHGVHTTHDTPCTTQHHRELAARERAHDRRHIVQECRRRRRRALLRTASTHAPAAAAAEQQQQPFYTRSSA